MDPNTEQEQPNTQTETGSNQTQTQETGSNPPAADPNTTQTQAKTAEEPGFQVPEAYKDKEWVKKFKTQEDLFKSYENLEGMVGKKNIVPDLNTATPEQKEQFYAQMRPESADAYEFDDSMTTPELKSAFGEMFFKHGISKAQGDALIAEYNNLQGAINEKMFGADGMKEEFKLAFGDNYEQTVKQTSGILRKHMSPEDVKFIENNEVIGNAAMAMIHKVVASLQKAYGIEESEAHIEDPAPMKPADVEQLRQDLRRQIEAEDKKPFGKPEDKQKLIEQLHNTYKGAKK